MRRGSWGTRRSAEFRQRTLRLHLISHLILHQYQYTGADGGNVYKLRTASTTIVGVRRYDLEHTVSARCFSWQPLIVLAGPTEPKHLESILEPTVDFFVKHDPGARAVLRFLFFKAA